MYMPRKSIFWLFLKVGALAFGGYLANVAVMQKELVERRKWLSAEDFMTGVTLAQMVPGPVASNVAAYCGYRLAGLGGAALACLGYTLPAFTLIIGLSALYFTYGRLPGAAPLFRGIVPVIIALIAGACYSLGKSSIENKSQLLLAASAFFIFIIFKPNLLLFLLLGGLIGLIVYRPKTV
jgi:chromate transporter